MPDVLMQIITLLVGVASLILLLLVLVFKHKSPKEALSDTEFKILGQQLEKMERFLREEMARNREELATGTRQGREELSNSFQSFNDSLLLRMREIASLQKDQLDIFSGQLAKLTQMNEYKLEKVREAVDLKLTELREAVEHKLHELQHENSVKLEQIRTTVDEKLHATLEQRLGESFKLVSERLELVHKGLGEMQALASGVGDLKKVLTNVKTRGTWGEIQLGSLLEQVLIPEQYATNVVTKQGGNERVEFAVKLPARDHSDQIIWLPLDAKFPLEDYHRLLEAQEQADLILIDELGKALENRIKAEGKQIREKYLDPPATTDFGIMFLPVEGLYAEVLRRPGLSELLQREYRVVVTGPTTLAALLNSLQMGFRTLAIEQRSSEVWALLGAVKTEFGRFGDILEKTQKKLQEASNTIESAAKKSRTIERKLKGVQELPPGESVELLRDSDDRTG